MAGWHHRLDGRESGWTPGVGDGQGGLACCDSWGRKESDMTERLNWTELYDRRKLANVIKSGILRWRDYSGWLGWASVITKVLISRRGRQESDRRRCDDGWDIRVTQLLTGRGPQAKKCGQPLEVGKGMKRNSSLETLVPCWHLDFILIF